ncbi:MAG TPA: hypothetical protein VK703_05920 [Candidatus Acidoferrales bacterium]|jgi:hypothetical protein|nr:hypothetical protein [Candidatus Acidoferrales bacterium]
MADHGSRFVRAWHPVRLLVQAVTISVLVAPVLLAQDEAPGPMAPPPEHHVTRIEGVAEPVAPPSLPPAEIIKAFTKKEELYQTTRPQFAYRKTIRIQEFGPDGSPSGEYTATYDAVRTADGKFYEKAISAPLSNLQYLSFEPEDAQALTRIPSYPVTASQLSKYDVKYLNTEKIDEIDCYIFQVSPRTLERQHALFDGIIWVDEKYLEVVKTYGKWVTDLGAMQPPTLPFGMFETYRENVDGKYWFPDYARADGLYQMKDRNIPIRVTIKWSNFKPFAAVAATTPAPSTASPPAPPAATAPATPVKP